MNLITIILVSMFSFSAFASIDLAQSNSEVSFLAVGSPGFLKIRGKLAAKQVSGQLESKAGTVSGTILVKLEGFDTGISLRNQHMKENYLHTAKFPEAKLILDPIAVGTGTDGVVNWSGDFSGKLSVHGVERPVKGTAKLNHQDAKWSGEFQFGFELSDHAIDIPSYLGVTVSKSVKVEASFKQ
jgi:polyisoprenoid-binding protein YceI